MRSSIAGECAHWIPGGQHDRILLEHIQHLFRYNALVNNDLEDELFEPIGGHDQIAFFAAALAPCILHTEFGGYVIVLKPKKKISFEPFVPSHNQIRNRNALTSHDTAVNDIAWVIADSPNVMRSPFDSVNWMSTSNTSLKSWIVRSSMPCLAAKRLETSQPNQTGSPFFKLVVTKSIRISTGWLL